MPENNDGSQFNDLISQVSSNEIETEDKSVKSETLQLLGDARGIIELASRQGKDKEAEIRQKYEKVRLGIIEATKNDLKITRAELNGLKSEVDKTNEKVADFYAQNEEMLKLELNKDIVIKTLNKLVTQKNSQENSKSLTNNSQLTVSFLDINPSLLNDINVLKATRPEGMTLFPEDILHIPNSFFQNDENLSKVLEITSGEYKSALIMKASKVLGEEKLISLIGKINSENTPKTKLQDKDIPINLLKKDDKNVMGLNEDWKEMHLNKINEITEDALDNILKTDIDGRDLADEVEYYLQKYSIEKIPDKTLIDILTRLNQEDAIIYVPKMLLGLDKKINVINEFSSRVDPAFIRFLPSEIAKNNEVQKNFVDVIANYVHIDSDVDFLLDYLEIDDSEIAKYFYDTIKNMGGEKADKVFSNFKIREKTSRVIGRNENTQDPTVNEMVKKFASYEKLGRDLINAVKANKETIEKIKNDKSSLEITALNIKAELGLKIEDRIMIHLVSEIVDLNDDDVNSEKSRGLIDKLIRVCGTEEKATLFIQKVNNYKITENVKKIEDIKKNIDKDGNLLKNVEVEFDNFLIKKIYDLKKENKDKEYDINDISNKAIDEYLESRQDLGPEQKDGLREILKKFVSNKKLKSNNDNGIKYTKALSGEISKEEYNKLSQSNFEKAYDFEAEKEIVKQQEKIENDYRIKNGLGGNNNELNYSLQYDYKKVEGGYSLVGQNGETVKGLVISEKEKLLAEKNPKAAENLVNFYETLDKLGLNSIWKYREDISSSIGGINGASLNYNDDSLGQNELKIFLNAILVSVGETKIDMGRGVDEFINLFRNKNDFQVIGEGYKNNTNKIGGSKIEEKFMEKYVLGFPKFQNTAFADSLSKPIVKT
ncbi:MAG: hypothetical protein PHS49_00945 [Candidatus Gracilibacteria bacterium]|nr:hypothetical protein [Candidatus Gracilibacteria bacterium]